MSNDVMERFKGKIVSLELPMMGGRAAGMEGKLLDFDAKDMVVETKIPDPSDSAMGFMATVLISRQLVTTIIMKGDVSVPMVEGSSLLDSQGDKAK